MSASGLPDPPAEDVDAEEAVLGAVLFDPSALDRLQSLGLARRHFARQKHAELYGALLTLRLTGEPLTLETVANRLVADGALERVGGMPELMRLTEACATDALVEAYARRIVDRAKLRGLHRIGLETMTAAGRADAKPEDVAEATVARVAEIQRDAAREEIVPLDDAPTPEIPADLFPPPLGRMIAAVSAFTETPAALAAMMGLGAFATAVHGRFIVQVKPGYSQPLNLYLLCALEPGNRKSAALSAMADPLYEWEAEAAAAMRPAIARARAERGAQDARRERLKRAFAGKGEAAALEELRALEASLAEVPAPPELLCDDVTPERLGTLLAEQGERLAILSAEGGLFDTLAGRYSGGVPNLDLVLKAHEGEPVRAARVGRASVRLARPALTLALAPQPHVVRAMAETSAFRGRGLSARFLYALPASTVGRRTGDGPPIPEPARQAYRAALRALLSTEAASAPRAIRLSGAALAAWEDFSGRNEARMRPGEPLENLRDWACKLPGQLARIAAILHCAEVGHASPEREEVSEGTMRRALCLGDLLAEHALAAFGLMGADPALEGARKVRAWIDRTGLRLFTFREAHQPLRGSFPRAADLRPALGLLEERGHLRRVEAAGGAGRPSEVYVVRGGGKR